LRQGIYGIRSTCLVKFFQDSVYGNNMAAGLAW